MKAARTTVSLPPEQQKQLQSIADQHGLSVAWLVRQAVAEFLGRVQAQGSFHPLEPRPQQRDG